VVWVAVRRQTTAKTGLRLVDIAKLAGVSKATASRALNDTSLVAPETLERIRKVVETSGYVPNLLAGGLKTNRSGLIAAIVPTIGASVFNEMIEAMIRSLGAAGYSVILGLASEGQERVAQAVTSMLSRRPEGVILTAMEEDVQTRQRLAASGVTVIETWGLPKDPIDVAVGFSHLKVGRAMAEFALAKGYRRPLVLTQGYSRARARMKGVVDTFRKHGEREIGTEVMPTVAYVNARKLLSSHLDLGERPDIVICSSDILAHSVITELSARGLSVPEDVAVFGFGNMQFGSDTAPPLTTVNIDGARIGLEIANVLLARSKGEEPPVRRIDVGFDIVERESV
jgi:LacI family gluconate utilization system Gnt-I transcriptional repressor